MTTFLLKTYDLLTRHRWLVLLTIVLLCGLAAYCCLTVSYQEDISKFLPQSKESKAYSELYKHIAHQNRIAVLFYPEGHDRDQEQQLLVEAMDNFGEKVAGKASELGFSVEDSFDDSQVEEVLAFVTEHYPIFLNKDDYARIDSLLSQPNYIDDQLEEDKKQLALPSAAAFAPHIAQDPLNLFTPVIKRLESLRPTSKFVVEDGHIFAVESDTEQALNSPLRFGLVYIKTNVGAAESRDNDKLVSFLESTAKSVETNHVKISMIGGPSIAVTNARQIKHDSLIAMLIAISLILTILIIHYRRLTEILWIVISIAFGWFMAIAAMALFHDEVSMIVLGIGSIIIGIAVNYPLHYLDLLKDCSSRREALRDMTEPLLTGNITTVGAFACLIFLNAEALRNLGVFGCLILIGTILFVLVVLPLYAPKPQAQVRSMRSKKLDLSVRMWQPNTTAKRRTFLAVLCVATIILFFFGLRTSFDSNIQNINYMTDAQRHDLKQITSAVDVNQIYAVARGKSLEEAQKANENLQQHISELQQKEGITVHGVGDFMPSSSSQQEKISQWTAFWTTERVSTLTSMLRKKSLEHGFNEDAFEPFYELLGNTPLTCENSDFESLTMALSDSYILNENNETAIITYIGTNDNNSEDNIKQLLRDNCSNCYVFSSKDVGNEIVKILSDNFNYIGWVCSAVVFIFLLMSFGRIELCVVSFVPLAISWIWILGMMQLFGVQFNIVNIILATFIFGQGDDYSIFITEGLIYENAYGKKRLHDYSNSVLVSALIMFIGIGALIVAKHPALKSLAIITFIGMFVVVIMAYYLPPFLFRWLTTVDQEPRKMPITAKSFFISLGSVLYFLFMTVIVLKPFTWLFFKIKGSNNQTKDKYHNLLQRITRGVTNHIPGVKVNMTNEYKENFERPAVIICNHQSHLDLMCLMSMTPKIIFFTNDWTWHNPFYANIIRRAEFLPVTNGYDNNLPKLKELVSRGYSIAIFPEGTRSPESKILRFHKGAFMLAQQLNVDIIPIFIHGAGDVLNKKEFMLQSGTITVSVGKRHSVSSGDGELYARELTKMFHKEYRRTYELMRDSHEDSNYWADFVWHQYLYKGADVARRCKNNLRRNNNYSSLVDAPENKSLSSICLEHCGQGEAAMLFAKVNRHCQVYAVTDNNQDFMLLQGMRFMPENIHILRSSENDYNHTQFDKVISLIGDRESGIEDRRLGI